MSPEQDKLRKIFSEALVRSSPEERERYLADACVSDPELRRQVDSLLLAHAQAGDFLIQNVIAPQSSSIGEGPGNVIGRYKLLQQIGEGGFGVVFMAEQQEPVRRMVALKIIKAGMDTREVVARFEAERQALALMDHPNIARVLDGGATASGRPYFVMDLVKGIPITEFCDHHQLPTEKRLRLFMQVCAAVQHAHQKGVIHRDLKPSNVLVTLHDGEPAPKVIDFGVAKAIGKRLTDKTLFTRYEQLIGTPAYMSPEQSEWSGLDIDTRSDLYSLGVLLYELLTGTTPLEKDTLARAAFDEIRRMIRETEPPKPSTRLTALVSADIRRHTSESEIGNPKSDTKSASLRRRLQAVRGDLDWIVMKALEKDRTRRYETVNALTRDIERHLEGEPVVACPASKAYRAGKFIRKHRVAVTAGAAIALALIAGLAFALVGFAQARRASQRAQEQAAIAQAVNDFLQNDFMKQADRWSNPDRDVKLRAVLDRASEKVKDRFANQPLVEASIRLTLGETYLGLGELEAAEPHIRRTVEIRTQKLGSEHHDTLQGVFALARLYQLRGMHADAEELLLHVSESYRRAFGSEHTNTLDCLKALGENYLAWDHTDQAEDILRDVLEKHRRVFGPEHLKTLEVMRDVAEIYLDSGRCQDAATSHEELLHTCRHVLGPENPLTLDIMTLLGRTYRFMGDYSSSAKLLSESVELKRRVNGPRHPETLLAIKSLADTFGRMGQWEPCVELCREITLSRPSDDYGLRGATTALLAGDTNAYREFAARLLTQFGQTSNPDSARIVAETCFLVPDSVPDLEPVFKLTTLVRGDSAFAWDKIAKGMAEYRRGNLSEALAWFERSRHCSSSGAISQAAYFRAMIHQRNGDFAAAQTEVAEATKHLTKLLGGELGFAWHEYGRIVVVRAEAERLIFGQEVSPSNDAALESASKRWESVRSHLNLADHLALQRRWIQARDAYLAAMREPNFAWDFADRASQDLAPMSKIGVTLLLAKDYRNHEQLCQGRFTRVAECPGLFWNWRVVKIYLAGEVNITNEIAQAAVQRATAAKEVFGGMTAEESRLIRAMAYYRSARYQEAVEESKAAEKSNHLAIRCAAQIFRAMALGKSGRREEGKLELKQAEARLGQHLTNLTGDYWWDLAFCQLALEEAQRLLGDATRK